MKNQAIHKQFSLKKIIQMDTNVKLYTTTTFSCEGNIIVNEVFKKYDISVGVDVGFNYSIEYN